MLWDYDYKFSRDFGLTFARNDTGLVGIDSASTFDRYLVNGTIIATLPSRWYRFFKFEWRPLLDARGAEIAARVPDDPILNQSAVYLEATANRLFAYYRYDGLYAIRTSTVLPVRDVPEVLPGMALECHPNPFNRATAIEYTLQESGFVTVEVYSPLGAIVSVLYRGEQDAGRHRVVFDAPAFLRSGVYSCVLASSEGRRLAKLLLVR